MASGSTNSNDELPSSLLEFCLRSLGEYQLIYRGGWAYVSNVKENAQLYNLNKEEGRLLYEIYDIPASGQPDTFYDRPPLHTVPAIVGTLKCLEFTTTIFIEIKERPSKPIKKIWKFIPLDQFIEQFSGKNKKRKENYMKLTIQRREELFWIQYIRRRGVNILPSIQKAIAKLANKGVDYWTLPDGTQVSWNKIRVKTLEVVPTFHSIMKRRRFANTIGIICSDGVDPKFFWQEMSSPQISPVTARRMDSELGIVKTHYVLEVSIDSEQKLIIDPTGIQYGLKGPKSTIIWYGTWEDYIKEFPGKILDEVTQARNPYQYPMLELETFFLGEGPMRYITRLTDVLVKNIGKKMCARCGLPAGPKVTQIHNIGQDSPSEESVEDILERKMISCPSCSNVYCNEMCKELDSENHLCV